MTTMRVRCAVMAALGVGGWCSAEAQSVRVQGVTSLQGVDVRPFVEDSVPIDQAEGDGPYRVLADGRVVRCVDGQAYCYFRRSGDRVTATPLVQDLRVAAWGFGQGISLHAHARARASLGNDDFVWPRASDEFDALEAYLQFERERLRLRLGRQWASNALGLYNYDGGEVMLRRGYARLVAFGGVSLVAGLNERHTGPVLTDIDDLPPQERGYLFGVRGAARVGGRAALGATYQRVIMANRAGLYSERVGADASVRALGGTWDAAYVYDLIAGDVNDAHVRVARAFPQRVSASITARRHRPFFESWTIWGAFSPVAFDEIRGTVAWQSAGDDLTLNARGGWRQYDETNAGLDWAPLRTDGWRAGAGIEWSPATTWLWYGDYDVDIGFGASSSDGTVGGRWTPSERTFIGGAVSLLENIYEFKIGTGRVIGVRVEGGVRIAREVRAGVDAGLYTHRLTSSAPTTDWSQRRFAAWLEWTVGRDPGEAAARRGSRAP